MIKKLLDYYFYEKKNGFHITDEMTREEIIEKMKMEHTLRKLFEKTLNSLPYIIFLSVEGISLLWGNICLLKFMGRSEKEVYGVPVNKFNHLFTHKSEECSGYYVQMKQVAETGVPILNFFDESATDASGKLKKLVTSRLMLGDNGKIDSLPDLPRVQLGYCDEVGRLKEAGFIRATESSAISNLLKQNVIITKQMQSFIKMMVRNTILPERTTIDTILNFHMSLLEHSKRSERYLIQETITAPLCIFELDLYKFLLATLSSVEKFITDRTEMRLNCCIDKIIKADEKALSILMKELLLNAIEATSDGHIEIYVRNSQYDSESGINISVKDDGVGVPTYEVDKIFDPAYSLESSEEKQGLGLYFVKGLLDQVGGKIISIETSVNQGFDISLFIPCETIDNGS